MIECGHGKLKRVINSTLVFQPIKMAHAMIKKIEVMRALRKGQTENFYYGQPLGKVYLLNTVFSSKG